MNRSVATLLIFAGLIGFGAVAYFEMPKPRLELVNVPISLRVGHIRTAPFTPDVDYGNWIKLRFQDIGKQEFVCLIGAGKDPPFYPFKCQSPPVLNVSWLLSSRGEVVAKGEVGELKICQQPLPALDLRNSRFADRRRHHPAKLRLRQAPFETEVPQIVWKDNLSPGSHRSLGAAD